MRMQEVIMQLRKLAPTVAGKADEAFKDLDVLRGLMRDLQVCTADETREALLKLIDDHWVILQMNLSLAVSAAADVQKLSESYKEKLGPRAKKPKDAEGQQMLPGLENVGLDDVGEAPTTMGETSTIGDRTPSFMRSGRHG